MQLMNEIRSYFDIASLIIEAPGILAIVAGGAIVHFARSLRNFISMTITLEIEGHWPWQRQAQDARR